MSREGWDGGGRGRERKTEGRTYGWMDLGACEHQKAAWRSHQTSLTKYGFFFADRVASV